MVIWSTVWQVLRGAYAGLRQGCTNESKQDTRDAHHCQHHKSFFARELTRVPRLGWLCSLGRFSWLGFNGLAWLGGLDSLGWSGLVSLVGLVG